MFLWRLTRRSRTNKKRSPFYHREVEYKSRKSRDIWSNRQVWPWSTKWIRVFPREHTSHSKHPLSTTQETTLHMNITRRPIQKSGWLYSLQVKMEMLCAVSKSKTRSWLWPDHDLLIAIFRLKLKKLGKTIRSFRFNLKKIPYDYTVEVTDSFKGLDLIECLKNYV